jgi:hypothetical protein
MRHKLRFGFYVASVVVAIVLTFGGFGYWAVALQAGDAAGQVFGIVTGGIFGIMLLAGVLVKAEMRGKPYRMRHRYRH